MNATATPLSTADRETLAHDPWITLAAWFVRIVHRRLEQKITGGWNADLSLQLDRLTDIRERLAEYLGAERRWPW